MRQGLNKQGKRNGNHSFRKGQGRHYCVCSHCAYSVEHKPGLPCRNLICPGCGLPLVRTDAESTITSSKQSLQGCEKSANLQANTSNESKKEQANSAIIKTKTKETTSCRYYKMYWLRHLCRYLQARSNFTEKWNRNDFVRLMR